MRRKACVLYIYSLSFHRNHKNKTTIFGINSVVIHYTHANYFFIFWGFTQYKSCHNEARLHDVDARVLPRCI